MGGLCCLSSQEVLDQSAKYRQKGSPASWQLSGLCSSLLGIKDGDFWRVHFGEGQTHFQTSRKESVSLMKSQILSYLKGDQQYYIKSRLTVS